VNEGRPCAREKNMLHIFDQKDSSPKPDNKQSLNRLHQMLGKEAAAAGQNVDVVEAPALPEWNWKAAPGPVGPVPRDRNPLPAPPETRPVDRFPVTVPARTPQTQNVPARDADPLTEKFAAAFLEGLSGAVGEIRELLAANRQPQETESLRPGIAALEEKVQQMERRLELQAGVIRTLHNAVQASKERLERLLAAFQGLQAAGVPTDRDTLPEDL
jgi:hypothetical protein